MGWVDRVYAIVGDIDTGEAIIFDVKTDLLAKYNKELEEAYAQLGKYAIGHAPETDTRLLEAKINDIRQRIDSVMASNDAGTIVSGEEFSGKVAKKTISAFEQASAGLDQRTADIIISLSHALVSSILDQAFSDKEAVQTIIHDQATMDIMCLCCLSGIMCAKGLANAHLKVVTQRIKQEELAARLGVEDETSWTESQDDPHSGESSR